VTAPPPTQLRRELGLRDAVLLGLGSILGTGVFVTLGLAIGIAGGRWVIAALVLAGLLATANGLSLAQLAAAHPVSGGTYEYGYRYLGPWWGFSAGWLFLCAKTASAATAALGCVAYAGALIGLPPGNTAAAMLAVLVTALVLAGLRRSSAVNAGLVAVTLLTLLGYVGYSCWQYLTQSSVYLSEGQVVFTTRTAGVLQAAALMFVAYTGYGRIATLGEEVKDPLRTIPRAILITMGLTISLYCAVALAGLSYPGRGGIDDAGSGSWLLHSATRLMGPSAAALLGAGAITAMLGVLLNLVLGLSRVALAMGRQGDLPPALARIDRGGASPYVAVVSVGLAIAALALFGSIEAAWSFSAFTVLVYYAITNIAALRQPAAERRYPRWIAWAGLAGCLSLAAFIEWRIALWGIGLLAAGAAWRLSYRQLANKKGR
jgi:APA family basic amino acid/polyamine antiporter